ncbi:DsbE family thiol:disulfide interchange protein [Polymorphum gilvum]|uniref:Periplasmic protein thiol:disulfide oxidoreductase DsbE:Thioredoxin type domain:Thioredoxin domain 2 n=1 Tax=Polymorphum gilvum (strain LMG 25793 / CGMCC 1.9160 / SL003B-26A1) TaxID=991905 RepID=F2J140_POLGS|nr:DsbE family thiol:disulfide interchange protein [Polymorphum gilvum]ADZ68686.1 Periplasmic protein thiol:disulfide oxidoreductase DsbE:Thioredoxin type domain:Thioredoxin domain 2 [Polymorphum gilvum SL003B-26A1]
MSGPLSDPAQTNERPARRGVPVLVLLPLVVFGALAALFLFQLYFGKDPSSIPSALINKPAPDMALPPVADLTRDGMPVPGFDGNDLRGEVSVVNVFASWCVPCRQEHPILEEIGRDDRIRLIGINYKDKPENARRFLGSLGNPYDRIGADDTGRAAIEWGVYGVPETYIVDRAGVIRFKFIGPLSPETYAGTFQPELERVLASGS